ncbi:hypothetical protein [Mucilaginibacter rubeus]|uniref:DUF7660 domain-containing protein n=1 Tax=Mucilaginibacter rubeus TaxID=2027860 RepID=A0A5C1I8N9_9SPHI|nr:hypothetical protein [Mucilaginibacter rubeus]QEM13171.1 hypothetical protein DEO27_025225 [Mucilaginibacter rubeus]
MSNNITPADVNDRDSFIKFVLGLKKDLETKGNSWENIDLASFLDALASYAEDIQGYYDNLDLSINADTASWRVFADMLKGAAIYE